MSLCALPHDFYIGFQRLGHIEIQIISQLEEFFKSFSTDPVSLTQPTRGSDLSQSSSLTPTELGRARSVRTEAVAIGQDPTVQILIDVLVAVVP